MAMRDVLPPSCRPRYFVGVESRTTILTGLDIDLVYRPDISVHATESRASVRGSGVAVLERLTFRHTASRTNRDEEIEETFLTIQELPGRKLVTVIEVLSPTNKKTKDARADYLRKAKRSHPSRGPISWRLICFVQASRCRFESRHLAPTIAYWSAVPRRSKDAVLLCVSLYKPDPLISDPTFAR